MQAAKQKAIVTPHRKQIRCMICDPEHLKKLVIVRHGQDITMALKKLQANNPDMLEPAWAYIEERLGHPSGHQSSPTWNQHLPNTIPMVAQKATQNQTTGTSSNSNASNGMYNSSDTLLYEYKKVLLHTPRGAWLNNGVPSHGQRRVTRFAATARHVWRKALRDLRTAIESSLT